MTSHSQQQLKVMESEHYGQLTGNKLYASSPDTLTLISVVNKLDRGCLADNVIDFLWKSLESGTKFQRKVPFLSEIMKFPHNTV